MRAADRAETGLLAGLRVLDLSIWRPGPYATQLLAEIGADVLKVEPPGGDPMRRYPELFTSLNANKRSIVLDLKADADRARALELAAEADVVVEGFRPGVTDRLGVGYGDVLAVNPTVIYCSVSGMGQDGPLASVPGHDLNYQAWAGVLAPEGGAPVVPAVPLADLAGGMAAAFAVCAAALRRANTGEGERIDVAMSDVLATWTGAARPVARGIDRRPAGRPGHRPPRPVRSPRRGARHAAPRARRAPGQRLPPPLTSPDWATGSRPRARGARRTGRAPRPASWGGARSARGRRSPCTPSRPRGPR